MHIFEEVLFLKLRTTEKQTINATYFVSDARGLAEGKGSVYWFSQRPSPATEITALSLRPASEHQTDTR